MEETEKYFVSDMHFDLPAFREHVAFFLPDWRKWIVALTAVFMTGYIAFIGIQDPWLLKLLCGAVLVGLGIGTYRIRDGGKAYRQLLELWGGSTKRNLIYIRQEGIRYRNPETENTMDVAYEDITAITRTKSYFVLFTAAGQNYTINHATLTGGTPDELQQWLMEKTGVTKVKHPVDVRIFQKLLVLVSALGLVLGFMLDGGSLPARPRSMSLAKGTQVLTELGIQVPEVELEDDFPSEYVLEELLCWAGMGDYDYDTFEWTPAESGVYAFDMEFFELGYMYTNFLKGVEALSGGELVFSDVVEDDSHVDFETGGGWKEITFTVDGQTRTLRAEMMYDWFDPEFANAVAEMTGDRETGKRLRFYFDGYQIAYVFWCDDAWAKDFAKETGMRLTDKLA